MLTVMILLDSVEKVQRFVSTISKYSCGFDVESGYSCVAVSYTHLVAAGKRLMTVITHNEGGTNKDLAKFTDQINALCDKWDR